MEPRISINNVNLTEGQAMTIRVALEAFYMELVTEGLGDDEMGVKIKDGYISCIDRIRMISNPTRQLMQENSGVL